MKRFFLGILVIIAVLSLTACNKTENTVTVLNSNEKVETKSNEVSENKVIPKSEQTGTAGSNIPLKDNNEEAEYQIQVALQYLFEEEYGDDVFDARIYVEKIYSVEDEEKNPIIKQMKLDENEVAFEVRFELKPSEGADIDLLSIPDGEYDEESGWITGFHRVGVLRPNDSEDQKYKITNFGTGW